MKATVVPYSSVVGSSLTLKDETGRVVCQLSLLVVGGDTPAEHRQRSETLATEIAARINGASHGKPTD